jgi:hypothetical protein
MLVDRESAIQAGSDMLDIFPIDEDHSDMVKFAQDGADYRVIVGKLRDLIESTIDTVLTSTEENSTSDDVTSYSNAWKLRNALLDLFEFEQTEV